MRGVFVLEKNWKEDILEYKCCTSDFWKTSLIPDYYDTILKYLSEIVSSHTLIEREGYSLLEMEYEADTAYKINQILDIRDEIYKIYKMRNMEDPPFYFDFIEISHSRHIIVSPNEIQLLVQLISHISELGLPHLHIRFIKDLETCLINKISKSVMFFDRAVDIIYERNHLILNFENINDYKCLKHWLKNFPSYVLGDLDISQEI